MSNAKTTLRPPGSRRRFLQGAGTTLALAATGGLLAPRITLAANGSQHARLVVVLLRGALDGLSAVPPVGDPHYAALRGAIALPDVGGDGGVMALDGLFGLHPALGFLGDCWQQRQLLVAHAVASPYRERSHFDGQDVLESGHSRPHAVQTGWLNRALANLPGPRPRDAGVALGTSLPLLMRGPTSVASWSPSQLAPLDDDTLQRLADLYAGDAVLSRRLADALAADAIAQGGNGQPGMRGAAAAARAVTPTLQAASGFLARPEGPRVAVVDTTGWDTHANEGAAQGQLAQRLRALDQGLRALREGLGDVWQHTAVLVMTEFGRTAAVNGTGGTDHGTGTVAFLAGGAVQGGRVLADWPGLAAGNLYEGRDLKPTTDLRSLSKTLLRDHLGVSPRYIDNVVFPDSHAAGYLQDVVRA